LLFENFPFGHTEHVKESVENLPCEHCSQEGAPKIEKEPGSHRSHIDNPIFEPKRPASQKLQKLKDKELEYLPV
jgi:hypothetical protein